MKVTLFFLLKVSHLGNHLLGKPQETVRNFFSKQRESKDTLMSGNKSDSSLDENVRNAIDLRQKKSKATDFYIKLSELTERIEVYQRVFLSKQPKYVQAHIKKKVALQNRQLDKIKEPKTRNPQLTRFATKRFTVDNSRRSSLDMSFQHSRLAKQQTMISTPKDKLRFDNKSSKLLPSHKSSAQVLPQMDIQGEEHIIETEDELTINVTNEMTKRSTFSKLQVLEKRSKSQMKSQQTPSVEATKFVQKKVVSNVMYWSKLSPPKFRPTSFESQPDSPQQNEVKQVMFKTFLKPKRSTQTNVYPSIKNSPAKYTPQQSFFKVYDTNLKQSLMKAELPRKLQTIKQVMQLPDIQHKVSHPNNNHTTKFKITRNHLLDTQQKVRTHQSSPKVVNEVFIQDMTHRLMKIADTYNQAFIERQQFVKTNSINDMGRRSQLRSTMRTSIESTNEVTQYHQCNQDDIMIAEIELEHSKHQDYP